MDLGIPAMTKCCNQLDVCYDTCGANKYRCDAKFRWCLLSICSDLKRSLGFVSNVEGRYLKCIDLWAERYLFSHRNVTRAPLLKETIRVHWSFFIELCDQWSKGEGRLWAILHESSCCPAQELLAPLLMDTATPRSSQRIKIYPLRPEQELPNWLSLSIPLLNNFPYQELFCICLWGWVEAFFFPPYFVLSKRKNF